ncbi:general transcription factor 3C polypeptide 2 [Seriola dumerili]|uniref:General transcription factor IIIC, polypeptide 2, beta n=1 Tax=Seriola dumerili TaxID=41447 RepID=A0A3B4TFZ1_SERDU|nr:general transcription factor 3C polypeptide 2 [Seriola dumerili]
MDPIDSEQGQEKPSEKNWDLMPSSKGRQRKKNPKYSDYETDATVTVQKTPKKSRRGAKKASETTPAKIEEAKNATQQAADGEEKATNKTPQESNGKTSEETPKKAVRAKKTPSKKTPAKKTPAKKTPAKKTPAKRTPKAVGTLPGGEGGVVDNVQQENGTPKPKRKYVRKQQKATPVTEPPCEEAQGEHPAEPQEEIEPGGRRMRGAAKAALKYLHTLAKEVLGHPSDESDSKPGANSEGDEDSLKEQKTPKGGKGRKGKKRKRPVFDSDAEGDEDFVPGAEEDEVEEMEDEEEGEDTDLDLDFRTSGRSPAVYHHNRTNTGSNAKTPNGLAASVMKVVWDAIESTKKFREEHYSSWVFPEWVPTTSSWDLVPQSDVEKYLPQELRSAAFKLSREGLSKEGTPLQRLSRFEAAAAHPERWDMVLYAGGPVWAMEWCPTPEGAPASQYIALACHRGMDEQHYVNKMYSGPGLVQLWDVCKLEYNSRPDSQPAFAYGLAQDKGFIWHLKWCPAGGWELPSCGRKAPFLPRLGLLAAATSTGVVTIYSLPHPDALHSNNNLPDSGKPSQQLPIYQAKGVLTLKLGSFKAPRQEHSGQVLSMDWLPEKPHNIMAIGFYDGIVGLWDLSTKSALLRVRESDGSLSLLPYRCLLAHDHAVRALAFCPASRHLLVTAGEDRYVKTWDLRRLHDPITIQKRYLTNEIYWPLNAPGLLMAQETAYVAKGSQGVHYFDHSMNSLFAIPRTGTLWSISYTEWLNSVVTADSLGEVILALLPQMTSSPPYLKRTIERRFPIYFTSVMPYDESEKENQDQQEGGEAEELDTGSEGGNENREEGGRGGNDKYPPLRFQTYKEAVKKYCLHHTDNDMRTFARSERRALWKRMKDTEVKTKMNLDEMPLASLHKVRFNPNMNCHMWVASAGQTGLVRLNCLRSMISPHVKDMISKNQAQFNALYSPKEQTEAVHTETEQL